MTWGLLLLAGFAYLIIYARWAARDIVKNHRCDE